MGSSRAPLPTFIIIGAQKSATRWLRINLGRHPQVYTAPTETMFFHSPERFDARGLEWYRAQFAGWAGEPVVGEATPGYMMWRHRPRRVAMRIKDVVPDARPIAILRNPVDRAGSAQAHFVSRGRLPAEANLLELIRRTPPARDPFCLVAGGWYAASLKPYRELFGDRLLVLLHDDIMENPARVYEQTLRHIGAAPEFVPADLGTVLFSTRRPGAEDSPDPPNGQRELSDSERQQVFAYFRDDVRMLEEMLGRDLSVWDPGGTYSVELGLNLWRQRPDGRPRMADIDVIDCYNRASSWIEGLVRAVSPPQYGQPTPCAEWNVGDLLDRLVLLPYQCAATLRGTAPPEAGDRDLTSDHVAGSFRDAADQLLTVMAEPGRLEGTVASPFGEMPAGTAARLAFVDQVTHGWDLATATGQDPTIPAPLLEVADRIVREELRWIPRRPEFFDVEVPAAEEATPTQRFAAFLGREPGVDYP